MADMPIKKGEKESASQGQATEPGRSAELQQRKGGGRVARREPPSVFSLTPRDFFTASPFELMRRFTEDMDRFFEGTAPGWGGGSMPMWSPPIEITEKDGQFTVCAELPGLSKDYVKVELTEEGLTISGERKQEQEERRGGLYRTERSYGSFWRTIPIPDDAQVEQAKATFENGLLTVSVPVPASTQRRREIPIESEGGAGQTSRKGGPSATPSEAAKAA